MPLCPGPCAEDHGFALADGCGADEEQSQAEETQRPKAKRAGDQEHGTISGGQHIHERRLDRGRRRIGSQIGSSGGFKQNPGQDCKKETDEYADKKERHVGRKVGVRQLNEFADWPGQHGPVDLQRIRHAGHEHGGQQGQGNDGTAANG